MSDPSVSDYLLIVLLDMMIAVWVGLLAYPVAYGIIRLQDWHAMGYSWPDIMKHLLKRYCKKGAK
jgi:hypothetical protein